MRKLVFERISGSCKFVGLVLNVVSLLPPHNDNPNTPSTTSRRRDQTPVLIRKEKVVHGLNYPLPGINYANRSTCVLQSVENARLHHHPTAYNIYSFK